MASTFTTKLGLEKPENNDYVDNWDAVINANLDLLDAASGRLPVVAADPPLAADGDLWLRQDLGELRVRLGGATYRVPLAAV